MSANVFRNQAQKYKTGFQTVKNHEQKASYYILLPASCRTCKKCMLTTLSTKPRGFVGVPLFVVQLRIHLPSMHVCHQTYLKFICHHLKCRKSYIWNALLRGIKMVAPTLFAEMDSEHSKPLIEQN